MLFHKQINSYEVTKHYKFTVTLSLIYYTYQHYKQ